MFFQPTRGSPTPDKPRRRVPGGGLVWLWSGSPSFRQKSVAHPPHSEKSIIFAPVYALVAKLVDAPDLGSGGFGRVGSSPIRRTAVHSQKKATTYTASPPGKPCKLLPLFVQLPWKAAVRRYFNAYSTLTYKKNRERSPPSPWPKQECAKLPHSP